MTSHDTAPTRPSVEVVAAIPTPMAPKRSAPKRLARPMIVQAKLVVGASDDALEREADLVAEAAMQSIQRQSTAERSGVASISTTTSTVSRISRLSSGIGAAGGEVDADTERAISAARGSGRQLDAPIRRSMEDSMGADFSAVRVHVGSQSDELNSRIQARAFTTGSDVFIRRQDYSPTTTSGQRLLAHELAHTVQQGAAPRIRRTLAPSTLIQRDQDEDDAKALEASDRVASPFYGHALDRHGPGVSDTALKTRLATGQAPDGAMVPVAGDDAASGISSKFASHKEYLATRASAHGLAKSQLDATADHLATLIPLAKAAIDDVAGKAGAEKGKAMAAKTKAVLALTNAAADTRKSTNGHLYAPVDSCDKKLMEAKVIAGGVALDDMFTLRPEYEVVIDHGRPIGYGFQGVSGQDLVSGAGKKMRVFDDAAPAKLDMPKTRTTFKVTGNLMLRPKTYTPSAWAVIQHFPADDPVGMRIKGAT